MKRDKKIPSILGVALLLIAMVGGVVLTTKEISFNTKASGDCQPVNPQVTNITYQSVDISFTTSASCLSSVTVNNLSVFDVRSDSGKSDKMYKNRRRLDYEYLDFFEQAIIHHPKITREEPE